MKCTPLKPAAAFYSIARCPRTFMQPSRSPIDFIPLRAILAGRTADSPQGLYGGGRYRAHILCLHLCPLLKVGDGDGKKNQGQSWVEIAPTGVRTHMSAVGCAVDGMLGAGWQLARLELVAHLAACAGMHACKAAEAAGPASQADDGERSVRAGLDVRQGTKRY